MIQHHLVGLTAHTGLLVTTERGMRRVQVVAVGPYAARLDRPAHAIGTVDITGPYAGTQAELGVEKAAEGLVLAFFNQGEVCTCPSRALVEESIYDDFMKVVMKKIESIKRGDPLDTDTMVGAQASEQQFDKILSYLEIAKGEGAQLLTGGKVEKLTHF
jgi:hypothetical protein